MVPVRAGVLPPYRALSGRWADSSCSVRVGDNSPAGQINATPSAKIYSVQPVRLPAAGRVSRLALPLSLRLPRSGSAGVLRNGDSLCPERGSASKAPRCWAAIEVTPRTSAKLHRATLLHGNHHIRLCRHAIHACHQRDVSGAKTRGQYQVDLVESGAGQPGKGWDDAHVVDEDVHGFSR
jgi:hypothetical protein